jgi:CarD family transcriptional regulator
MSEVTSNKKSGKPDFKSDFKSDFKPDFKPDFKVGDIAVYPAYGVGTIESIEVREINREQHELYIIKIIETGIKIMLPILNVESIGLRRVIDNSEIPNVYSVLGDKEGFKVDNQTWNRRYREYMDKLKTGSIFDVAEVFRDLYLLRKEKVLSFGERKLFDTASSFLVKEISISKNTDEETIWSEINALFPDEKKEEQADINT